MTTLPFDIDTIPNVAFTSNVDQQVQYKQAWYAVWTALIAIGDDIEWSCNGTSYGAGDHITVGGSAGVRIGSVAGSEARSYGCVRIGVERIIWETNDTFANANPRTSNMWLSASTYPAPSATTARPVAVTAGRESAVLTAPLIGWSSVQDGFINVQTAPDEQLAIIFTKITGNAGAASAFIVHRTDATNNNGGDAPATNHPRMAVYFAGGTGNTALDASILISTTNWRGLARDLNTLTNNPFAGSLGWSFTNWPGGQDSGSQGEGWTIGVGANNTALAAARSYGFLRWMRGFPTAVGPNHRNPLDPALDTHTWWTIGDVGLIWPKAAGDMQ